jgi:diketogulonate reductase-like aldo/keto reductase
MPRSVSSLLVVAVAGASAASLPTLTLNNGVSIPRMLLGTGGGGGGFNVSAWLEVAAALGTGFDTAYTYCYEATPPFCSHVAIYNAVSQAGLSPSSLFYISKTEPEDFGAQAYMNGFGRVVDRGILQDMAIPRIDMLMMHQAGRHSTDNNYRPPCFNESAAGPAGPGAYADCRVQTFQAFLAIQKAGTARSVAVSNWQVRDLQQVFAATGVYPAANEIEVVSPSKWAPYRIFASSPTACEPRDLTSTHSTPTGTRTTRSRSARPTTSPS